MKHKTSDILPYLVVKREEAGLGVEFQSQMRNRGGAMTQAEYDDQYRIFMEMRALKKDPRKHAQPCEADQEI